MSDFENVMGLRHENEGIMNCLSSGLRTNVSEMAISSKPSDGANPFLASSDWDLLVSLSQVQTFGGSPLVSYSEFANSSYPLVLENQGMSSTSHLVQYVSDSNVEDMVPKVPSYGSGSFLEMVGSFGQPGSDDVANTRSQPTYKQSNEVGIEKGLINNEQSQGEGSNPEEVADAGSAPSENRRERGLECNFTLRPHKNAEGNVMKECSVKNYEGVKEQDVKKQKVEQSTSAHLRGKQSVNQNKDNSHEGEAPKENLVHVRAGRGQATNSHSLAERVRREKISERMRFLQELVPGCNKITGKALMLDEIINYVQSLQQQVEFLSMKLATVKPELNFDVVERILSKDILQPRIRPIGGYGPSNIINSSHPFPSESLQATLAGMPNTSTQFPPFPRTVLENEFHSFYGMSYHSNTVVDNLAPNNGNRTDKNRVNI